MRPVPMSVGLALILVAVAAVAVLALRGEEEFVPSYFEAEWECPDGTIITYIDTDDPEINAEPPVCPPETYEG